MSKKLFRSNNQKVLGGVCGGVAEYFDIDPVLIRALFLILVFGAGTGILIYIIGWIIIPQSPFVQSVPNNENYFKHQSSNQDTENSGDPNNTNFQNVDNDSHPSDNDYQNVNEFDTNNANKSKSLQKYFAFTIIIIGFLILFEEYIDWYSFKWGFPTLLIGIGAIILYRSRIKED